MVFARALARRALIDWVGVGDADGNPLPVTPEGIDASRETRPKPSAPAAPILVSSARTCRPPSAERRMETRLSAMIGFRPCFRMVVILSAV